MGKTFLSLIFLFLCSPAFAATQKTTTTTPAFCDPTAPKCASAQYVVTSNGAAKPPSISMGIKHDAGITNVLYDHETDNSGYGICRYIDNTSRNDYFVPQGSLKDFMSFIDYPPPGIAFANCVMPEAYNYPTPSFANRNLTLYSGGVVSGSGTAPTPAPSTYANPVNIPTPPAVQRVGTILNFPVTFTYARTDCRIINNNPVCSAPLTVTEKQNLTAVATAPQNPANDGTWKVTLATAECYVNGVNSGPAPAGCLAHYSPPPDCQPGSQNWGAGSDGYACSGLVSTAITDMATVTVQTGPTSRAAPVDQGMATFVCNQGLYILQSGFCNTPVYGTCGWASGQPSATMPSGYLCTEGYATSPSASGGYWQWICEGAYGGDNSPLCQSTETPTGSWTMIAAGSCTPACGQTCSAPDTYDCEGGNGLCDGSPPGTATTIIGTTCAPTDYVMTVSIRDAECWYVGSKAAFASTFTCNVAPPCSLIPPGMNWWAYVQSNPANSANCPPWSHDQAGYGCAACN